MQMMSSPSRILRTKTENGRHIGVPGEGSFYGYLHECKRILLVCTQASKMLLYYMENSYKYLPVVVQLGFNCYSMLVLVYRIR